MLWLNMEKIDEIDKKTYDVVKGCVSFDDSGRVFIPKKIRDNFKDCAFLPKEEEDRIILKKVKIR